MKGLKITSFLTYFNSRLGVKRPLFLGVKLGVKVTPKKGLFST